LTAAQATLLASLSASYTAAYNLAVEPPTRTKSKISDKNVAKKLLTENLRDLNRFVQATKTVSDSKKIDIGFPVYANRTPIPAPTGTPVVKKVITIGRRSTITMRGSDDDRRGRPTGVQGALIISYTGAVPPGDIGQWRIEGLATRTKFEINWPATIAVGSQVWVAAAWYSPRGQTGQACTPISVAIGNGLSMAPDVSKDADGGESLKEAA
jgi:hypothetical protein